MTEQKEKTDKREYSIAELDIMIEETQKMIDECNSIVFHYKSMISQQDRYGFYYVDNEENAIVN